MRDHQNIDKFKQKIDFGIKFWLKFDDKSILGTGWARLLDMIDNNQVTSLSQAAEKCNYSYKYAWNILKRIEKRTGNSPVITSKGGTGGGGTVKLNNWGLYILKVFKILSEDIENFKLGLEQKIKKLY